MEPELPVGSMVFVRQVEPTDIAVGDNATFYRSDGAVVTHQVYEIDPAAQMIGTQGIANKNSRRKHHARCRADAFFECYRH